MIRSMVMLLGFILQGLAAVAGIDSAQAQGKSHCESQAPTAERRDIDRLLNASGAAERFGFKAKAVRSSN